MKYKFHPTADAFPLMKEGRLSELIDDIKTNGLRQPVTLCGGMILDGRNRALACEQAGIDLATISFEGDPWAYAWSLNGQRRDLADEQRYLLWKHCREQSEAFRAELERIQEEANKKRSEAAKGNDNASKEKEKTVVEHNEQPLNDKPKKKAKTREAKGRESYGS